MKIVPALLVSIILCAVSCAKMPVDRNSIGSAVLGLQQYLQGERVDIEQMFYPTSIYFNGAPVKKPEMAQTLRADFSGTEKLVLKSERIDPDKNKRITVYSAVRKNGTESVLIIAWLKLFREWNVLFITKGDSISSTDVQTTLKRYEQTYNKHVIKNIFDKFFDSNVCFVQGMTTGFGYADVNRGLNFVESYTSTSYAFSILEQYALGSECDVTIGEMKPTGTPSIYNFIYVWKTTGSEKRIVAEFDFT